MFPAIFYRITDIFVGYALELLHEHTVHLKGSRLFCIDIRGRRDNTLSVKMLYGSCPGHLLYIRHFIKRHKVAEFIVDIDLIENVEAGIIFPGGKPYGHISFLFGFYGFYLGSDISLKNTSYGLRYLAYGQPRHSSLIVIDLYAYLLFTGFMVPGHIRGAVYGIYIIHVFAGYHVKRIEILAAYPGLHRFPDRRTGFRHIESEIVKSLNILGLLTHLLYYFFDRPFPVLGLGQIDRYLCQVTRLTGERILAILLYLAYGGHIGIKLGKRQKSHYILYRSYHLARLFKRRTDRRFSSYKEEIDPGTRKENKLYHSTGQYDKNDKYSNYPDKNLVFMSDSDRDHTGIESYQRLEPWHIL